MVECSYCGSDVTRHENLAVLEDDETVGRFCNYACLVQYVDEEELAAGACCRL